jgi:hypothetical protein
MSRSNPEPFASTDLAALEAELRQLLPREGDVDRDALLFRAGQASVRPNRLWPVITCLSTLAACVLGGVLFFQPCPQMVEQIIYVPIEGPVAPPAESPLPVEHRVETEDPPIADDLPPYRQMQEHLFRFGLDGLAPPPAPPPSRPSPRNLRGHYSQFFSGEVVP